MKTFGSYSFYKPAGYLDQTDVMNKVWKSTGYYGPNKIGEMKILKLFFSWNNMVEIFGFPVEVIDSFFVKTSSVLLPL
jgi:hypothetical protein